MSLVDKREVESILKATNDELFCVGQLVDYITIVDSSRRSQLIDFAGDLIESSFDFHGQSFRSNFPDENRKTRIFLFVLFVERS